MLCMSYIYHILMLPAALPVIAVVIAMGGSEAGAQVTDAQVAGAEPGFDEHPIEFHNQDVNLAGSLL